jgi:5-formyltetrahydrofolate cyclo-ligase
LIYFSNFQSGGRCKFRTCDPYWPNKGEFGPLPALHRWKEDGELIKQPQPRRIGLPVVDKVHKTMRAHAWYPGCPMEGDAFGIPQPKDTEVIVPSLLFVACVGYAPGGYRLVYGGGLHRCPWIRQRVCARFRT